jgi:hypothetical protein
MTEEEWLACSDPFLMLDHLDSVREWAGDRKLRLFCVECCRLIWNERMWEGRSPGVEAAEQYAEGNADPEALRKTWLACLGDVVAFRAAKFAAEWAIAGDSDPLDLTDPLQKTLAAAEVVLLRDVFGNPFRPVALDPAWLTSDVLTLARGIYEEKAFDRMPILADALQDAGCDSEDVLTHCRNVHQQHVRGCWVVDLLGKK